MLAASQLVYIMSSFKEINDLLFEFLWERKRGKIKRPKMISANYGDGQNVGHHAGLSWASSL